MSDVTMNLLLLPGLLSDAALWAPQVHALQGRVNATVADFGDADTLTGMAHRALAQVPAGRFALAGHSMGGRVALEVLRLAGERVDRLALLATGVQPLADGEAGARERSGRMALLALAQRDGMRAMAAEWALGMVHPDARSTPVFDTILDMFERHTPAIFEAQIHALLARPDATPQLARINCPTLLVCGRDDAWNPPSQHEAMQRAIADSRLVVVEHCGHMVTLEQPDAVSQALADWLDMAPPARA